MAGAGADVWARTFAQLMAETKPQDNWALLPQDSLAAGCLDSGGLQCLPLTGVSLPCRLQCSRCLWAWSSAHVHVLFHLWWDRDSRRGLVKMRVWGQRCRLCPPPPPLNVHIFLSRLVLHILQKCYGDRLSPDQCPQMCFGDRCEACHLRVCFLQKVPDPAWGHAGNDGRVPIAALGGSSSISRGTPPSAPSSGPPASKGCSFVSVPFSLVDMGMDQGPVAHGGASPGGSSLPAAGSEGQGSICLSGSSTAAPEGKGIAVGVRDPIFQGRGLLLEVQRTFELGDFLFRAGGASSRPVVVARGRASSPAATASGACGQPHSPADRAPRLGLGPDGEGSPTFPLSFARAMGDKDAFTWGPTAREEHSVTFPFALTEDADAFAGVAQGNRKEGGHQGLATAGHDLSPATNAGGLTSEGEGSLASSSLPGGVKGRDSFTDITEGREKEDGSQGPAGHESCPPASAHSPVCVSEGSITIPFSVLDMILKGPGHTAHGPQDNGLVIYSDCRKRRLRSSRGRRREADLCPGRACRRPPAEPYKDVWIWVSTTVCIFWLLCTCRLNPGISPGQV
uniref:Receptor transporter protein 5 (putative) n=1 Tax=Microcebus murinus TaxID=30608 RepID=A0A8C5YAA6_MICMU